MRRSDIFALGGVHRAIRSRGVQNLRIMIKKHGDAFLNLAIFLFGTSVITQTVTLSSDEWVYADIPELPFGIELPENGSFHTEGMARNLNFIKASFLKLVSGTLSRWSFPHMYRT